MSNAKQGISKEGAAGKNMAGALAGHVEGAISSNYKGILRNPTLIIRIIVNR